MCGGGGDSSGGGDDNQTKAIRGPMVGYKPGDVLVEDLAPLGTEPTNVTQEHNPHLDSWSGDVDEHNNMRDEGGAVDKSPKVSGNPGKDISANSTNVTANPTSDKKGGIMSAIGNAIVNTLAFGAGGPAGLAVLNAGRAAYGAVNPNSQIGISVPEAIGNTLSGGLLSKGKVGQAALTSIAGNMASGKNLANPQNPNTVRGAISNMSDIPGNFRGFGSTIMGGVNTAPLSSSGTTNNPNLGMIHSNPVVGTKNNISDIPGLIRQQRTNQRDEFGRNYN